MDLLLDALAGGLSQAWLIARVVIPLMILLQLARDLNLLDGLARFLSPLTRLFGMSAKSAFPLLVGLIFGLSYGAGVIFDSAREDGLTKRDLFLLVLFLDDVATTALRSRYVRTTVVLRTFYEPSRNP